VDTTRALGTLIPELDVTDIAASIDFYALLGFRVQYERTEEGFACLACPGAELMLQAADGPGRRFRTAALERPFGRGVNFQLEVDDVDRAYRRVQDAGHRIEVALEERWYRVGASEVGNRQFVVADGDGYLIRPFTSFGAREA
jgi:catechol 2,3-dioxygenase-like lactoylglutathione lyase family enzyme